MGSACAHTAFTAMIGAGIGIANQARPARVKRLAVVAGVTAAMTPDEADALLDPTRRFRLRLKSTPPTPMPTAPPTAMLR